MNVKDIKRALYKIKGPKGGNQTPRTPEPVTIIRAALYNRSFDYNSQFSLFAFNSYLSQMGKDQTTSSHFSTAKTLTFISFQ